MSAPFEPQGHQNPSQTPQSSLPPAPPQNSSPGGKDGKGGKILMWSCIAMAIIAFALVAFGIAGFFLWKSAGDDPGANGPSPQDGTTTSASHGGTTTTPPSTGGTTPPTDGTTTSAPAPNNDLPQDPAQIEADFYASLPQQLEKWSTKDVGGDLIYSDGDGGRISFLLVDPNGTPDDPTGGRGSEVIFERGSCGQNRNRPEHVTCTIYPKKFDTAMFTMTSKYSSIEEMQRIATAVIDMP